MTEPRYDVIAIGNAIVDVMAPCTDELIEELAAIFPDEYIHLGGDEVDGDCWLSDEAIAAWAKRHVRSGARSDWKAALQALFVSHAERGGAVLFTSHQPLAVSYRVDAVVLGAELAA